MGNERGREGGREGENSSGESGRGYVWRLSQGVEQLWLCRRGDREGRGDKKEGKVVYKSERE